MASLRKKGNRYYSIVSVWNAITKSSKQIYIPLQLNETITTRVANRRHLMVNKEYEHLVKAGDTVSPEWLSEDGKGRVLHQTLSETVLEYLSLRPLRRESTIKRDRTALNQLMDYTGEIALKGINEDLLEKFKVHQLKTKTEAGMYISLRHIKAFLNWCVKVKKYIDKPIYIPIPNNVGALCYLNEWELNKIYGSDEIDQIFKDGYYFMEQTGVRPNEMLKGELERNWLIVDMSNSKTKRERYVELSDELKGIIQSIHAFRDEYLVRGKSIRTVYDKFQSTLYRFIKKNKIGGRKHISLKSFRHTYAIKRITMTKDIFEVSRKLGHTNVTTTQKYLNFPEQKRRDDFPSLFRGEGSELCTTYFVPSRDKTNSVEQKSALMGST